MKNITIIIPARKGSKSIKNKNRVLLNNIPLVEYSIIVAKLCKYADKIILTSDDRIILDMGRKYDIDVIERPKYLATDTAKSIDVIKHVIENRDVSEDIMLLEPTSPIRLVEDLNEGIETYFNEELDSLYSLSELKNFCIAHIKIINENNKVFDAFIEEIEGAPRQFYDDKYYYRDGVFYIFKKKIVIEDYTLYGNNSKGYITKHETADINSFDDLSIAERLLKKKEFQFYQKNNAEWRFIYIDVDETICHTPKNRDYSQALPIVKNIRKANKLYDDGNFIVYWTGRGTVSGIDWREITEKQFKKWNVKYHELRFGKPNWHLLIDDRVLNTKNW